MVLKSGIAYRLVRTMAHLTTRPFRSTPIVIIKLKDVEALQGSPEREIDAQASESFMDAVLQLRHAMIPQPGWAAPNGHIAVPQCEFLDLIVPPETAKLKGRRQAERY
jgi:hypothetical protein